MFMVMCVFLLLNKSEKLIKKLLAALRQEINIRMIKLVAYVEIKQTIYIIMKLTKLQREN